MKVQILLLFTIFILTSFTKAHRDTTSNFLMDRSYVLKQVDCILNIKECDAIGKKIIGKIQNMFMLFIKLLVFFVYLFFCLIRVRKTMKCRENNTYNSKNVVKITHFNCVSVLIFIISVLYIYIYHKLYNIFKFLNELELKNS